ncbi:MAG: RIP metalloprotease RseP [Ignavibacteria bacterium GWF2_33_9]|nr:MAG: RIP metalloprotease RseP [Ignavibacteria bacterium GWF2_33_9]
MEIISSIFYFVIVLGILVLVHEFGHFIAAKISGMRAEVFSIGMGPRILGYHKKVGFTFGKMPANFEPGDNTDYRLSILPIGGYVKISGMIDESMDKDFLKNIPQPYEFRSKNAFLKTFVLSAGVIMNFLLAIAIFAIIAYSNGQSILKDTTVGYIEPKSIAAKIGMNANDKILQINENKIYSWNDIFENMTSKDFGSSKKIVVQRNGKKDTLSIEGKKFIRYLADKLPIGIEPKSQRVILMAVEEFKPAGKAGFKRNDTVVAVNGESIAGVQQFTGFIKSNKNREITIEVIRKSDTISIPVKPNGSGLIGVALDVAFDGKIEHKDYNLFEAASIGVRESVNAIFLFGNAIGQIFNGNLTVKESIGGPVMIAQQANQYAERGLFSFMQFIAMLSVTLAVINILPLPALDGGHLIFVIVEAIIRREVSPKVKVAIQQVGVFLLLFLMAFVIYNDFTR